MPDFGTGSLPLPVVGEAACLSAAFLWALSVFIFRKPIEAHGARAVNFAKCLLAAVLQGVTLIALGQLGALRAAPLNGLLLVAASGLVGFVIGDTALFAALARIGVHRTLLLQSLAPLFTALIAALWQGEHPTLQQALGGLTILGGVAVVVAPSRRAARTNGEATRGSLNRPAVAGALASGVALGVLAAFGQGAGIVLAKVGMTELPILSASFVRLAAGALGLAALSALLRQPLGLRATLFGAASASRVIPATILGTYVAVFLMMTGVAWVPASVAAVLLGTPPVFSLLLERVIEKRPITARGLVGTLIAVAGIGVLATA